MAKNPPFFASMVNAIARGPVFAAIGTSFEDMASRDIRPPSATPSRAYMVDGALAWARVLSFQRINLPAEYILGVSGSTLSSAGTGFIYQADDAIKLRPDYCIVGGVPNDVTRLLSDVKADWIRVINKLQGAGIVPVVLTTAPRGTNSLTSAQLGVLLGINDFIRNYCAMNRNIILADVFESLFDPTSATANALAGMIKSSDNLHPSTMGAFYMGKCIADALDSVLVKRPTIRMSQPDIYNAANNPTGNLLYLGSANYGMMTGTGGTLSTDPGLTHSGTEADGIQALRGSSTSTCTWTHGKEDPRTDAVNANGVRQTEQVAAGSGGSADEIYSLRRDPALADIATGDLVFLEFNIEVLSSARMLAIEAYLLQQRPTNSYTAIDLSVSTSAAGFMPTVAWKGRIRTPPIAAQADAQSWQARCRARLDATAGAASVSYKIGDMAVRKLSSAAIYS